MNNRKGVWVGLIVSHMLGTRTDKHRSSTSYTQTQAKQHKQHGINKKSKKGEGEQDERKAAGGKRRMSTDGVIGRGNAACHLIQVWKGRISITYSTLVCFSASRWGGRCAGMGVVEGSSGVFLDGLHLGL